MEFSVIFDKKAAKELLKLPEDIKIRIRSLKVKKIHPGFLRDWKVEMITDYEWEIIESLRI